MARISKIAFEEHFMTPGWKNIHKATYNLSIKKY